MLSEGWHGLFEGSCDDALTAAEYHISRVQTCRMIDELTTAVQHSGGEAMVINHGVGYDETPLPMVVTHEDEENPMVSADLANLSGERADLANFKTRESQAKIVQF